MAPSFWDKKDGCAGSWALNLGTGQQNGPAPSHMDSQARHAKPLPTITWHHLAMHCHIQTTPNCVFLQLMQAAKHGGVLPAHLASASRAPSAGLKDEDLGSAVGAGEGAPGEMPNPSPNPAANGDAGDGGSTGMKSRAASRPASAVPSKAKIRHSPTRRR